MFLPHHERERIIQGRENHQALVTPSDLANLAGATAFAGYYGTKFLYNTGSYIYNSLPSIYSKTNNTTNYLRGTKIESKPYKEYYTSTRDTMPKRYRAKNYNFDPTTGKATQYKKRRGGGLQRVAGATGMLLAKRRLYNAPELKSVDLTASRTFTNSSGQNYVLGLPLQGAGFFNRIGATIKNMSLDIKYQVHYNSGNTATFGPSVCRLMIFYDRQFNGVDPIISDVLQTYDAAGTAGINVNSGLNPANKDRFLMLRDIRWNMPGSGTGNGPNGDVEQYMDLQPSHNGFPWVGRLYIKLPGLETRFRASAGTSADIQTGALCLMTYCDNGTNTTTSAPWVINFSSRLRFYD